MPRDDRGIASPIDHHVQTTPLALPAVDLERNFCDSRRVLHWIRRIRRIFQAERLHRSRLKEKAQRAPISPSTSASEKKEDGQVHFPSGSFTNDVLAPHYEALELPPGASLQDVKNAYRRLMQKYHPDHHQANENTTEIANEVTRRLSESYQLLRTYLEGRESAKAAASSPQESD